MALVERLFPVMRPDFNFFDDAFVNMQLQMEEMEKRIEKMRQSMFELQPRDEFSDVMKNFMQVGRPVVEEKGQSKLKLEFDVKQFKPEEVNVKVVGNNILQVHAKHHEKSGESVVHREYYRQYQLPEGVNVDLLKPTLSKDGVLQIEAPAPALKPRERQLSIEYKSDEEK
nr:small heat shock protein [Protodriloides chaetifer]